MVIPASPPYRVIVAPGCGGRVSKRHAVLKSCHSCQLVISRKIFSTRWQNCYCVYSFCDDIALQHFRTNSLVKSARQTHSVPLLFILSADQIDCGGEEDRFFHSAGNDGSRLAPLKCLLSIYSFKAADKLIPQVLFCICAKGEEGHNLIMPFGTLHKLITYQV